MTRVLWLAALLLTSPLSAPAADPPPGRELPVTARELLERLSGSPAEPEPDADAPEAEEPPPASTPDDARPRRPRSPRGLAGASRAQLRDDALKAPADITLSPDRTLGEAMQALADRHGLAFTFADPALADTPLSKHFEQEVVIRGIPLATALTAVLKPMGLAFVDRDGQLAIERIAADERPAAARIAAALRQETELKFDGTPLREALEFMGSSHGINVLVDEKDLSAAGIGLDAPVSMNLRGVPLEAALSLLLEPYGLTYVTAHDALLVTSAERAAGEIDTRSYDVSALVGKDGYAADVSNVLSQLLEPRSRLAADLVTVQGGQPVPLPQPRIVPYQGKLLVTASWADQRRVSEILQLMESQRAK